MRAALAALVLLGAAGLCGAQGILPKSADDLGPHGTTSIGPRATFYDPKEADHGEWAPGVQARLHLAEDLALEGSLDYAHFAAQGTTVHVTPIQFTLLGYFTPNSSLAPYILIGGGWYVTHSNGPYVNPRRRFGPHIGAGLELLLDRNWSLDASYRFLWTEDVGTSKTKYLLGRDYSARGHMITLGLNRRFGK